jgi:glycosyltransferase involved in cell wall biosynthesis
VERPFFSIVIPTHDRPGKLTSCLRAIQSVQVPSGGFEVIVVDDGSPCDQMDTVIPFRDSLRLSFVRIPRSGISTARNTGAAKASGTYLAFTDDDCRPDKNWLRALEQVFLRSPGACLSGRTINGLNEYIFSSASQTLIEYLHAYYNAFLTKARFATGSNLAVPAQEFHALGGFSPAFVPGMGAEDTEFLHRWLASGRPVHAVPEAVVLHYHDLSWKRFLRQHFLYGQGAAVMSALRRSANQPNGSVEPIAFYTGMLRFPFLRESWGRASLVSTLLLVAQIAYVSGYAVRRLAHTR